MPTIIKCDRSFEDKLKQNNQKPHNVRRLRSELCRVDKTIKVPFVTDNFISTLRWSVTYDNLIAGESLYKGPWIRAVCGTNLIIYYERNLEESREPCETTKFFSHDNSEIKRFFFSFLLNAFIRLQLLRFERLSFSASQRFLLL